MSLSLPNPPAAPRESLLQTLRTPIWADLLRHRIVSGVLATLAIAQVVTAARHLTVLYCPMAWAVHLPCPGCGLTRATVYFSEGHFREAAIQHLFAPVVVVAILTLLFATLAPTRARDWFCRCVEAIEKRTGITMILFALFMIYWLIRIIACPSAPLAPFQL